MLGILLKIVFELFRPLLLQIINCDTLRFILQSGEEEVQGVEERHLDLGPDDPSGKVGRLVLLEDLGERAGHEECLQGGDHVAISILVLDPHVLALVVLVLLPLHKVFVQEEPHLLLLLVVLLGA